MNQFEVQAEVRSARGTGASRRLRRAGKVPAVVYGADKDVEAITVDAMQIGRLIENEAFFSHILTVKIDGQETQAVLKSMQRDPASSKVTHIDFLRISATHEITMHVPLHFMNEDKCPGRKLGGVVSHLMVDLEVTCLPQNLPEFIAVDMSALEIGDSVHLSDLAMPEGVTLTTAVSEHNPTVVSVQAPQKLEAEEEAAEEAAAAGVAAPGAAEPGATEPAED